MKKQRKGIILSFIIIPLVFMSESNADLDNQKEALDVIANFADRICNDIPIIGGAGNIELSGEARLELNKLLKNIVGLGIEGGAKYQRAEYNNVLQKDLAGLLIEGGKCKLDVFRELKDKLLISTTTKSSGTSSVTQITTGDKSPTVTGVSGNVTIIMTDSDDKK